MVQFGPFWLEEVHFGPFRSANRTLAIPEQLQQSFAWCWLHSDKYASLSSQTPSPPALTSHRSSVLRPSMSTALAKQPPQTITCCDYNTETTYVTEMTVSISSKKQSTILLKSPPSHRKNKLSCKTMRHPGENKFLWIIFRRHSRKPHNIAGGLFKGSRRKTSLMISVQTPDSKWFLNTFASSWVPSNVCVLFGGIRSKNV